MSDRLKTVLALIGMMLLFYAVAPYLLRGVLAITKGPYTVVRYEDAVQGRITGEEVERQYHMFYLDNKTERKYSFNAFMPPLTPAQRKRLGLEEAIELSLGWHLKVGDYVRKQANSKLITVQRGNRTSRWFCSTPEEREQSRKRAR